MKACGNVFKYGDNVDTDVIIPARYLNATKGEELAKHCMEDIDKEFVSKVQKGDIIVANKNFGCGSSREHAPLAIKCAGVSCVIAETFTGMPLILECPLLNVLRLPEPLKEETWWRLILIPASLPIRPETKAIRGRHSRHLCRRSLRPEGW